MDKSTFKILQEASRNFSEVQCSVCKRIVERAQALNVSPTEYVCAPQGVQNLLGKQWALTRSAEELSKCQGCELVCIECFVLMQTRK